MSTDSKFNATAEVILQLNRNTEDGWAENDMVLEEGEPALLLDTESKTPIGIKYGDGKTKWSELPYFPFERNLPVDQEYNSESENAQSGKAVEEAVRDKVTAYKGDEISIPIDAPFVFEFDEVKPFKEGDIYINTDEEKIYRCIKVATSDDGNKSYTFVNVENSGGGTEGKDGLTPFINNNGNWQIGDNDTGVKAQGKDGYTPQKGVDYFDGEDGYTPVKGKDYFDGVDGDDGISPTVNITEVSGGHKVSITDKDGTKTFDVLNGQNGYTPQKGMDYFDGKDGHTPIKGTDYWTPADKAELIQEILDSIGCPVFGVVDAENTIILNGNLADGTYTFNYEDENGTTVEIGNMTIDKNKPSYTNQIPISIDTDGSIFNDIGYRLASRINSSGVAVDVHNTSALTPAFATGYIPVKNGDIVRLQNCFIDNNLSDSDQSQYGSNGSGLSVRFYKALDSGWFSVSWLNFASSERIIATPDANGHITEFTITATHTMH